ncbi:hypothetical protein EDD69_101244 [Thermolongibacillus altinsuensis]|uniref:Uncharacterized protein n=1 Tax=Thermolongibacillus altinsuensis TaxID=575256 RepID=A0A4R1QIC7_9BACL|nr:hypothetical protein [Thermolongibacillus altinsuensis]TCL53236.1 hypothetical protein EDD69_101244 [Thermolongibacillus altinsuensis]
MECGDQHLLYVEGMFVHKGEYTVEVQVKGETLSFLTQEEIIGFCAGDEVGVAFCEKEGKNVLLSLERLDGPPLSYAYGEWFAEIIFIDWMDERTFLFDLYRSPYRDHEKMIVEGEPVPKRQSGENMTVIFVRKDGKNVLKKIIS